MLNIPLLVSKSKNGYSDPGEGFYTLTYSEMDRFCRMVIEEQKQVDRQLDMLEYDD